MVHSLCRTATYDLPQPRHNQTHLLAQRGCHVIDLKCTNPYDTTREDMESAIAACHVVIISGGNTLFATDRWHAVGLPALLRTAMNRGAVLCGGSAGAICWFDGGHSDSGITLTQFF